MDPDSSQCISIANAVLTDAVIIKSLQYMIHDDLIIRRNLSGSVGIRRRIYKFTDPKHSEPCSTSEQAAECLAVSIRKQ